MKMANVSCFFLMLALSATQILAEEQPNLRPVPPTNEYLDHARSVLQATLTAKCRREIKRLAETAHAESRIVLQIGVMDQNGARVANQVVLRASELSNGAETESPDGTLQVSELVLGSASGKELITGMITYAIPKTSSASADMKVRVQFEPSEVPVMASGDLPMDAMKSANEPIGTAVFGAIIAGTAEKN